ncbi:cytochrome d ubiquinol oxidase subunit II [Hazenella sp. IB182357]|uniref:Cytochrome d ubiquinol oxidase subunit II n=2 Tax=Polycladospora coralii TaxID=2771432 RepID=A0A926NCU0_9BACL|nr:cytochrome d ubiquinol oxidase subunit II [Polycladospora coralii]MBS7531242.1 cytochrome d ubiquinol oxidase subunit II [Polycladospora coralii]
MAGSVDFGASFWAMIYRNHETQAGNMANRFLSPTWEITNTILVLMVVAVVAFFPQAAFMFGTILLVPLSLILILILFRSSFMVFSYSVEGFQRTLKWVSGLTGLLVPVLLISALPITEGGFVTIQGGYETLQMTKWLSSPSVYIYMLFGLTSELFLSSLFLADYARESEERDAYQIYRKQAILFGPLSLLMAALTVPLMEPEAAWLISNLEANRGWFLFSVVLFVIGYSALWWSKTGKPRVAVVFVASQYAVATFAYGKSHLPYMIYPYLKVDDAFTNLDTFYSLLSVLIVGMAILLPGFLIFWRLFLKDRRYLQKKE